MNVSIFLLDSNVFIEAAKRYYNVNLVPSFWSKLVDEANKGRIISIDRVKAEIDRKSDWLATWADTDFKQWFEKTRQPDVLSEYSNIMNWANINSRYTEKAKKDFAKLETADAWVVAHAKAKGYVVVSHEQLNPTIKRKIPIPNVCKEFHIPYLDTFQMLSKLNVVLGNSSGS